MVAEHEHVGNDLERLRRLTADYQAPDGACNTFRGLFHGLAELERELHEHIHVENNVLFPRALALEAVLRSRPAPAGTAGG
jgi:regulator of cell morphogenesis and NO signaling